MKLLSPSEVADLTGLSKNSIYRAIEDGELRAFKLRSRLRVDPDDIHDWLERNIA